LIFPNAKELFVIPLNRAFPKKRKPWNASPHEESFLENCRRRVEEQYANARLGSGQVGGCFGSILCHELHSGGPIEARVMRGGKMYEIRTGISFLALAAKWGISVSVLGELVADHCKRLEKQVEVTHDENTPIVRKRKAR
jgi:hypothetical protein